MSPGSILLVGFCHVAHLGELRINRIAPPPGPARPILPEVWLVQVRAEQVCVQWLIFRRLHFPGVIRYPRNPSPRDHRIPGASSTVPRNCMPPTTPRVKASSANSWLLANIRRGTALLAHTAYKMQRCLSLGGWAVNIPVAGLAIPCRSPRRHVRREGTEGGRSQTSPVGLGRFCATSEIWQLGQGRGLHGEALRVKMAPGGG